MLIDTHAHIFLEYYENIQDVVDRAKEKNVQIIINNGCDKASNEEVLKNLNANLYGALGIHPEFVDNYEEKDLKFIEDNLANPMILAIGEIGLDYHYTKENKEKQIDLFERQLKMAEEYDIPVIIHSRDATEDTINSLKKFKVRGVIHSFSGSYETAQIYLKMGFKLGINGVITFKNSKLKDVVSRLRLEDIVLETDSPYLTPVPLRGSQNESQYVFYVAKFIANLFNISQDKLAEVTSKTACEIFDKLHIS